jgi:hypothetical protein
VQDCTDVAFRASQDLLRRRRERRRVQACGSENAKLFRVEELHYSRNMKKVRMISVSLWKLKRLMIKSRSVHDNLNAIIKDQSRVGKLG